MFIYYYCYYYYYYVLAMFIYYYCYYYYYYVLAMFIYYYYYYYYYYYSLVWFGNSTSTSPIYNTWLYSHHLSTFNLQFTMILNRSKYLSSQFKCHCKRLYIQTKRALCPDQESLHTPLKQQTRK
jgi:hypothetical protein